MAKASRAVAAQNNGRTTQSSGRRRRVVSTDASEPVLENRCTSDPVGAIANAPSDLAPPSISVNVGPEDAEGLRLVIVEGDGWSHQDRFDIADDEQLEQFIMGAAEAADCDAALLEDLRSLIDSSVDEIDGALEQQAEQATGESGGRKSQATAIVESLDGACFFHTPDGEPFATIEVGDHHENWPIKSQRFQQHVRGLFYREQGKAPGGQAMRDALGVIECHAIFDGREQSVSVRVGEHDGAIYIDLGNPTWQAVRINRDGWTIVSNPRVKFRRPRGMLPLPNPQRGGSIDELRPFVNAPRESDWQLLIGEILAMFNPNGPYPVVVNFGEQGTAKTTRTRVMRECIDPQKAAIRSAPRDERDLMIAATNSYVVALDNLSFVNDGLSDSLCRLATGGGFATRELYTDSEEKIFDVRRPVIINGIEELATRGDLLDRAIVHELTEIPANQRRAENEFWRAFREAQPRIIGAFLTATSAALRNLGNTEIAELPRMADFAMWVSAAEGSLGWNRGTFVTTYNRNRAEANYVALEASPLVAPLCRFMDRMAREQERTWQGTATRLLSYLEHEARGKATDRQNWPKSPASLSNKLRRLAPNLKAIDIRITFRRSCEQHRQRIIEICVPTDFRVPRDPSHAGPGEVPRG